MTLTHVEELREWRGFGGDLGEEKGWVEKQHGRRGEEGRGGERRGEEGRGDIETNLWSGRREHINHWPGQAMFT